MEKEMNDIKPIRAVIFDLGGVLVRTEDPTSREELARRLGMTYDDLSRQIFDSESAHLATIGKIDTKTHWEAVRKSLNLSQAKFPKVQSGFWGGDRLDNELVNFLRSLRSEYKTALLSNAWDNLRGVIENEWKIADAFDEMIISAEVGVAKPAPRIYQIALERLEVAPQEAVFVDDFFENVLGAREVGLQAIHFTGSEQVRQDLEQLLDNR